ncbi:PAS domain-containing protein [Algoriphagus namhaensis]
MIDYEALMTLSQMAISSEYFLQATIDKQGRVISSDSGIGPMPTLFDKQNTPLFFSDCFLASDWTKYENKRINAWKNSRQSFLVELNKIVYPEQKTVKSKWEFFFLTKDFGTCLGIGHPMSGPQPFDMGLGDYFERADRDSDRLLTGLLEDQLLGFWEYDYTKSFNFISQGFAQILGYPENELKNSKIPWARHIHADDIKPLVNQISSHFQTTASTPFKSEFRLQTKGNQVRWVYCFGKTIEWNPEGNPSKLQGCMLDITERKKQEIWMKEHSHFLKNLVFDQSHTLRSKVANISGLLEIIELEQDPQEIKRLLSLIKEENKMLDQILKKSIRQSVKKDQSLKDQTLSSDLI